MEAVWGWALGGAAFGAAVVLCRVAYEEGYLKAMKQARSEDERAYQRGKIDASIEILREMCHETRLKIEKTPVGGGK